MRDALRRLTARREAIALSDARVVRRALLRTTIVRLVLACMLVALAAAAVWRASNPGDRGVSFLPARATTVVVLDQSKSVYVSAYLRIAEVLHRLADANVPVGLVVFSDSAYELLPPGTRGSELRPLLRFFTPGHGGSPANPQTRFPTNPWQNAFSGGTKISAGLSLAQSILHRDHVRGGTILLLSDLGTAGEDQPRVAETLLRIGHDHGVALRIVPLFPIESDRVFFERFVPRRDFVRPSQIVAARASLAQRGLASVSPWPFVIVAGLLLAALAANELLCGRVMLRRPREAGA
ncbi:MAG: VWA domain-containing protein [Actinobacteria bacterium]|nr:MAG: VWA domain-containing protein [Actinomycetota bacterium]